MTTFAAKLIEIARRDVGQKEQTANRAPFIKRLWPETSYPEGYANREPYCSAGMCYVFATAGRELAAEGKLKLTTGMTLAQYEAWRCKSAGAWRWHTEWAAKKKGVLILPDTATVQAGDVMVFDMSHIGLVVSASGSKLNTIEYNTGPSGGRDGDGCWDKVRERSVARVFLRMPFN